MLERNAFRVFFHTAHSKKCLINWRVKKKRERERKRERKRERERERKRDSTQYMHSHCVSEI